MLMVKRWFIGIRNNAFLVTEERDGAWVHFSDYDALAAELDQTIEEAARKLNEQGARLADMQESRDTFMAHAESLAQATEQLEAQLAETLAELDKRVFSKGSTPPFAHIEYCGLCHYSREWIAQHGHGENCLLRTADSASVTRED